MNLLHYLLFLTTIVNYVAINAMEKKIPQDYNIRDLAQITDEQIQHINLLMNKYNEEHGLSNENLKNQFKKFQSTYKNDKIITGMSEKFYNTVRRCDGYLSFNSFGNKYEKAIAKNENIDFFSICPFMLLLLSTIQHEIGHMYFLRKVITKELPLGILMNAISHSFGGEVNIKNQEFFDIEIEDKQMVINEMLMFMAGYISEHILHAVLFNKSLNAEDLQKKNEDLLFGASNDFSQYMSLEESIKIKKVKDALIEINNDQGDNKCRFDPKLLSEENIIKKSFFEVHKVLTQNFDKHLILSLILINHLYKIYVCPLNDNNSHKKECSNFVSKIFVLNRVDEYLNKCFMQKAGGKQTYTPQSNDDGGIHIFSNYIENDCCIALNIKGFYLSLIKFKITKQNHKCWRNKFKTENEPSTIIDYLDYYLACLNTYKDEHKEEEVNRVFPFFKLLLIAVKSEKEKGEFQNFQLQNSKVIDELLNHFKLI